MAETHSDSKLGCQTATDKVLIYLTLLHPGQRSGRASLIYLLRILIAEEKSDLIP